MANSLLRMLPFASRTRPANPFVEQFQAIVAHAVPASDQLLAALDGAPDAALARISEIEHGADDAVEEVHRLVDKTFIAPYDKRDIVKLAHELDSVVDSMRTAVRSLVSYRALEAHNAPELAAIARALCAVIRRSVDTLKEVVDRMPEFDHDSLRQAARAVSAIEDEADELLAKAIRTVFPDPNQPLTAAMLAWQHIFRLLEHTTDCCDHAIGVIISIARQEGS